MIHGDHRRDLHVTLSVRNNVLKTKREELGLSTVQFAEKCGVAYGLYISLETMKLNPLTELPQCARPSCKKSRFRGKRLCGGCSKEYGNDPGAWPHAWEPKMEWRDAAKRIAEYMAVPPEELFPDGVLAVKRSRVEFETSTDQLASVAMLASIRPDEALEGKERLLAVGEAMGRLTTRQRRVLEWRFQREPLTLEEVGEKLGVSRERVRAIEGKALRRLRHPAIARQLKEVSE